MHLKVDIDSIYRSDLLNGGSFRLEFSNPEVGDEFCWMTQPNLMAATFIPNRGRLTEFENLD